MRSLQLIIVLIGLFAIQPIKAASSELIPNEYFTVSMPFELEPNQTTETKISEQAETAMELLLMRLTGQARLVNSTLGQRYISQAKGWLANYNIKPRYEDGVVVGKNIQFNFDSARLKKAFAKQNIKMWPQGLRPKTLVMGVFIQQGRLQKLTSEILDYRIDVDFRSHPESLALPYTLPDNTNNWVFPVDPSQNRSVIQEQLLASGQQNLLSFKLTAKGSGQYELAWYLFNLSGVTLQQNSVAGGDRQTLFKQMFSEVMQTYVKLGAVKRVLKNHVLLNVNQIASGDLVNRLEEEIRAQQPLVRDVNLVLLKAGSVQFDIEYQGELLGLIGWLRNWPMVTYIGEAEQQVINVNVKPYLNTEIRSQLHGQTDVDETEQ